MDNFNKEMFAKDIVLKRVLEKRISLRKAAKEADVHFSNLSRYERQETEPTITHLLNICKWLNTDISKYLKTGNKEPKPQQSSNKTFAIYDVSQQRELLLAFMEWESKNPRILGETNNIRINEFLRANNCG
jgi:transcriptional regulator with XRE-family HTH domain